MEERILTFLSNLETENKPPALDTDTDLFESGFLDSFGFVELVGFIEATTGQTLTEEDMDDPRFTTVAGIVEVLNEKTALSPRLAAGGSR